MRIDSASFVKSSSNWQECPSNSLLEFSFIGRSNVGKSSLINAFTDRTSLAKTSNKPGKTQLINHFLINEVWHLVDLPGYGYAKTSKEKRKVFQKMILDYLLLRKNLLNTFLLIDVRIKPQEIDLEFISFLGENNVPFSIVFTKADKLGKTALENNINHYKEVLLTEWEQLPKIFISSSTKKLGIQELRDFVGETIKSCS